MLENQDGILKMISMPNTKQLNVFLNTLETENVMTKETAEMNKMAEYFKKLYLKAMYDLNTAGVITFLDRELIEESVGQGKPFPTLYALAEVYGFYPAEISNIRNGVRKMKSDRIRILLQGLEKLKRNES